VLPEHYSIVHDNLMESVAEVLGDAVTPDVAQGWSDAVNALAGILIDAEETLYAEAEGRRGGWRGWREFSVVERSDTQASASASPVATLSLQPTDGLSGPFDFTPGQYLTMRFPNAIDEVGDAIAPRHYTITSAPGEPVLQCTVKHVDGGVVSGMVHQQLHEGATVELSPPFGAFSLPTGQETGQDRDDSTPPEKDIILVSAGIGVTPMYSFSRSMPGRIGKHLHVDSTLASNPFHEQLSNSGINYQTIETGPDGALAAMDDLVAAVTPPKNDKIQLADASIYLCGPDSFMADTKAALMAAGANDICYENFGPRTQI
jgi:nitric oxide dioxygenase